MAPKLSLEARMTIIELLRRGWSRMAIAESLGVTEGSVRYHERRRREGKGDGRVGRQQHRLAALSAEVDAWLSADGGRREHRNLAALHDYLVAEHGYDGSLRSVQRYFRAQLPAAAAASAPPG
jgi:transposase